MHACMYIYVLIYVCTYLCTYIYIHIDVYLSLSLAKHIETEACSSETAHDTNGIMVQCEVSPGHAYVEFPAFPDSRESRKPLQKPTGVLRM